MHFFSFGEKQLQICIKCVTADVYLCVITLIDVRLISWLEYTEFVRLYEMPIILLTGIVGGSRKVSDVRTSTR